MNAAKIGEFIVKQVDRHRPPMTQESMKMLMAMSMAKDDDMPKIQKSIENEFLYKVLDKRIEACIKKPVDLRLKVWLVIMCHTPGDAVLMTAVLKYLDSAGVPLTLDASVHMAFSYGIPNREIMLQAWDLQKDGGANVLDTEAAWA